MPHTNTTTRIGAMNNYNIPTSSDPQIAVSASASTDRFDTIPTEIQETQTTGTVKVDTTSMGDDDDDGDKKRNYDEEDEKKTAATTAINRTSLLSLGLRDVNGTSKDAKMASSRSLMSTTHSRSSTGTMLPVSGHSTQSRSSTGTSFPVAVGAVRMRGGRLLGDDKGKRRERLLAADDQNSGTTIESAVTATSFASSQVRLPEKYGLRRPSAPVLSVLPATVAGATEQEKLPRKVGLRFNSKTFATDSDHMTATITDQLDREPGSTSDDDGINAMEHGEDSSHFEDPPGEEEQLETESESPQTRDRVAPSPDVGADSGLAVAHLVDGTSRRDLPIAQEVDLDTASSQRNSIRAKKMSGCHQISILIFGLLVALVAVVVVVAVVSGGGNTETQWGDNAKRQSQEDDTKAQGQENTGTPSQENNASDVSSILQDRILALLPDPTVQTIRNSNSSPQKSASEWLVKDRYLPSYSDWRIVQRFALASFYYATGGERDWSDKAQWLSYDHHECDWNDWSTRISSIMRWSNGTRIYPLPNSPCGVHESDSSDRRYQHLWLEQNGLRGELPDELFLLTDLLTITMFSNDLEGTISSYFGKLQKLEAVSVSTNKLKGTIPTDFGTVTTLRIFDFHGNMLEGTLPSHLGMLQRLEHAWLDTNKLTGSLPTELGLLTKLSMLYLFQNEFSGFVPSELGQISPIHSLQLSDNNLKGASKYI